MHVHCTKRKKVILNSKLAYNALGMRRSTILIINSSVYTNVYLQFLQTKCFPQYFAANSAPVTIVTRPQTRTTHTQTNLEI